MAQVIVIGGGLAGLSAAHTAFERGAKVLVIDKNPFCGGNSTKATSGFFSFIFYYFEDKTNLIMPPFEIMIYLLLSRN